MRCVSKFHMEAYSCFLGLNLNKQCIFQTIRMWIPLFYSKGDKPIVFFNLDTCKLLSVLVHFRCGFVLSLKLESIWYMYMYYNIRG